MELVGKIHGTGPSGELIVRTERPWRWGEGVKLVDRRGRTMGRVENIIGPAASPYLVVRTLDSREGGGLATRLKGIDVYVADIPGDGPEQPAARARVRGRPTGKETHADRRQAGPRNRR